MDHKDRTLHCS